MTIDNGGPAFPRPGLYEPDSEFLADAGWQGMSLRDWFAGQALAGLINTADFDRYEGNSLISNLASIAYGTADAMLEARRPPE